MRLVVSWRRLLPSWTSLPRRGGHEYRSGKGIEMQAIRPMPPRDPQQEHRAATPLELLFDLVSVIAIAVAAAGLHHAVAEAHAVEGILKFVAAFFAIWWAWMNFT